MAVTKSGDCCTCGNDDLSNKLISNGSDAFIEGSDPGSMYDLLDDHLDNISQFSPDTVKCVNEVNQDTVTCIYINSESLLYGSGNKPTNNKSYDSPDILIHLSSLIANSLCRRHSTLGGGVTGLSDCSVHSVCDDILGQSLLHDGEALTPDTKSIAVHGLSHNYQDSVSQILQDTFISPNSHDCSTGRAAAGFRGCCARGDSDLSNQSISSSSEISCDYQDSVSRILQSNKVAKIRNRYNQVPHLTQDTNGKVTNSQKTPQTRAKRSALSQQVTTKHI